MLKEDITYAAIIPLIGGLPIGVQQATGKFPEYVISYDVFQHNDQHYINYIREHGWKGKYHVLDYKDGNIIPNAEPAPKEWKHVNVICGVPPCAGLSSLSRKSKADSEINDWMLKSCDFVLETLQPEIYFFENAPRLATKAGELVSNKLLDKAKKYGYNFLIYTTESRLHGSPQIRPRTYAIFLNQKYFDKKLYRLHDFTRPRTNYKDLMLVTDRRQNDKMNVIFNNGIPTDDPYFQLVLEKTGIETYEEFMKTIPYDKSLNILEYAIDLCEHKHLDMSKWMEERGFLNQKKRCEYRQTKVDANKGYFTHGLTVANGQIPAFIGIFTYSLAHPIENRYLTIREMLTIMDMPQDFNLVGDDYAKIINHICQNVCVYVARDMMTNMIAMLTGANKDVINATYAVQRHKQSDIIIKEENEPDTSKTDSLFE